MKKPGRQSNNGVPEGWRAVRLGDVAIVSFSSVDKRNEPGQRVVKLCNYMEVWKNSYIHSKMDFMEATATDQEIKNFRLRPGDVLLTKDSETREEIADPAVVREVAGDVVLGYHLALIRPNPKKVHGPFLSAQLSLPEFRKQFVRAASGTTRFGLGLEVVRGAIVWLPSLPQQYRVSETLIAIDEAIDQTRESIEQARRVKVALLQDVLTNGLPGRHTRFKETKSLGLVPATWKVVKLQDIAKVDRGKFTHRPRNEPRFYGGDIPFVQTSDVVNSGDYLRKHSQTLNELGLSISRMFPAGTILFVIAGTVGEPTIASYDVAFPDSVVGITPRGGIDPLFLIRVLQQAQRRIVRTATESAQANISLELLRPLPVVLPGKEEQEAIAKLLRNAEERIERQQLDLDQLKQTKAALSQALLTGRITVSLKGGPQQ